MDEAFCYYLSNPKDDVTVEKHFLKYSINFGNSWISPGTFGFAKSFNNDDLFEKLTTLNLNKVCLKELKNSEIHIKNIDEAISVFTDSQQILQRSPNQKQLWIEY